MVPRETFFYFGRYIFLPGSDSFCCAVKEQLLEVQSEWTDPIHLSNKKYSTVSLIEKELLNKSYQQVSDLKNKIFDKNGPSRAPDST